MRATRARDLLLDLSPSFDTTGQAPNDRTIADALCSVGEELPKRALSQVLKIIGASYRSSLLFDAARKDPPDPAGELIAKAIIRQKGDLRAGFFAHARAIGAGAEAAGLVAEFSRASHLPSLIKRLAKMPTPSAAMVEAAYATLSKRPKKEWFDLGSFLPTCALMGLLLHSGDETAAALVDRVAAALDRQMRDELVHEPLDIVARLRKGLGVETVNALAQEKNASRNPVVALAKSQGFSLAGKADWKARVWLARGEPNEWFGALQEETQLLLVLNSKGKPYWEVTVCPKRGNRRYHNVSGKVLQDDLGLPPLKNIGDLPGWLPKAGKKLRTSFTPAKAKISVGRQKKIIGELRAWLEG